MRHLQTFNQRNHGTELPDNWEDIKKQLDEKNYPLDYQEITYLFSDLIDEEVIEIEDIKKYYRYDRSYNRDEKGYHTIPGKYYGTIKYDIKIKILDKSRVKDYMDYKWSVHFYSLLNDYYGYRMLNGVPRDYFDTWPERDIDEFNFWGKSVFI